MADPRRTPRTFASPAEAVRDLIGVARRAGRLNRAYLRGGLDPALRERVMVAVSRVNACSGCTFVHERLAGRAGVSPDELEAIGMGDLGVLDDRDRAAVAYATALAEGRFRGPAPAGAAAALTPGERAAIEAVARAIAFANLSANTVSELVVRVRPSAVAGIGQGRV